MKKFVETMLFGSRWVLVLFYTGLIVGLAVYSGIYIKEIYHLILSAKTLDKESVMLALLELVDMVMIANLIKMIITGSYHSFIDKTHGYDNENVSSGMLKIKMSTSLIGVSSIHLLQTFINVQNTPWDDIYKGLAIHITFLVGALILADIEYLHEKGCSYEKNHKH